MILSANSFEEIAEKSREHCMEKINQNDKDHLDAMNKMKDLMQSPEDMNKWFEGKRSEFN